VKKVKCPHCGFEWNENVEGIYDDGDAPVVKKSRVATSPRTRQKRVDLVCPKCKREFEFSWEA